MTAFGVEQQPHAPVDSDAQVESAGHVALPSGHSIDPLLSLKSNGLACSALISP